MYVVLLKKLGFFFMYAIVFILKISRFMEWMNLKIINDFCDYFPILNYEELQSNFSRFWWKKIHVLKKVCCQKKCTNFSASPKNHKQFHFLKKLSRLENLCKKWKKCYYLSCALKSKTQSTQSQGLR